MKATVVIKGNKREVPSGLPPLRWAELVQLYKANGMANEFPWTHPMLEYLEPEALLTVKAKALVWLEYTGVKPTDLSCWWEMRQGRKAGEVPYNQVAVAAEIDINGILHCGHCGARWTPDRYGEYGGRCNLCGYTWHINDSRRN